MLSHCLCSAAALFSISRSLFVWVTFCPLDVRRRHKCCTRLCVCECVCISSAVSFSLPATDILPHLTLAGLLTPVGNLFDFDSICSREWFNKLGYQQFAAHLINVLTLSSSSSSSVGKELLLCSLPAATWLELIRISSIRGVEDLCHSISVAAGLSSFHLDRLNLFLSFFLSSLSLYRSLLLYWAFYS